MKNRTILIAIISICTIYFASCSKEDGGLFNNSNNSSNSGDAYYLVTNRSGISGVTFYIEEYNENDRIIETYTITGAFSKKYHANSSSIRVEVTAHMISSYTHNDTYMYCGGATLKKGSTVEIKIDHVDVQNWYQVNTL